MLHYFILCFINIQYIFKQQFFLYQIDKRRNEGMFSLLLFKRRHLYRYSNAFLLSKHFLCNYINSFHNYQHARCDLQNVLLDIIMMIAPYHVPHQLMEATVLNNVLVLVHHVIMSMDASPCPWMQRNSRLGNYISFLFWQKTFRFILNSRLNVLCSSFI